jgi:hypothetical protein
MTKMPEPIYATINARELLHLYGEVYIKYISEEQLKQYGRDLLEEAAQCMEDQDTQAPKHNARAIRAMKDKI